MKLNNANKLLVISILSLHFLAYIVQFDSRYSGSTSNTSAFWWLLWMGLKPILADDDVWVAGAAALLLCSCNWALTYADICDLRYIFVRNLPAKP